MMGMYELICEQYAIGHSIELVAMCPCSEIILTTV